MSTAPIPRATFTQLRTFDAVARLGSVTRAAAQLHLTQPTVSTQLRQLSDGLGVILFEPVGRGIRLTDAGVELHQTVGDLLTRWASYVDGQAARHGSIRGVLRVAGVTTSEYFVARLLRDFLDRHPEVEIDLAVDNRAAVIGRLERGDDDCAVMMLPPNDERIDRLPFLANPLVAIVSLEHDLALNPPARPVSLKRFASEPLLMREPGSGTRRATEEHFAHHRIAVEARMTLCSNEAVKHAVAAGLGVAIVSHHTLSPDPSRDGLCVARVATLPIRRHWNLAWRRDRALPVATRAFIGYVRGHAEALAALNKRANLKMLQSEARYGIGAAIGAGAGVRR